MDGVFGRDRRMWRTLGISGELEGGVILAVDPVTIQRLLGLGTN
jgi:hypothetical protein